MSVFVSAPVNGAQFALCADGATVLLRPQDCDLLADWGRVVLRGRPTAEGIVVPASPGLARRILALAEIVDLGVDPRLVDLAQTGRLTENDFASLPFALDAQQRRLTQTLLDVGLRAVVPVQRRDHGLRARQAVLAALLLAEASPLHVSAFGGLRRRWADLVSKTALSQTEVAAEVADVAILAPEEAATSEAMAERRTGALVLDWDVGSFDSLEMMLHEHDYRRGLASEVERTIVLAWVSSILPNPSLAAITASLFPGAGAERLSSHSNRHGQRPVRGFQQSDPQSLRGLFNVCDDLSVA